MGSHDDHEGVVPDVPQKKKKKGLKRLSYYILCSLLCNRGFNSKQAGWSTKNITFGLQRNRRFLICTLH